MYSPGMLSKIPNSWQLCWNKIIVVNLKQIFSSQNKDLHIDVAGHVISLDLGTARLLYLSPLPQPTN